MLRSYRAVVLPLTAVAFVCACSASQQQGGGERAAGGTSTSGASSVSQETGGSPVIQGGAVSGTSSGTGDAIASGGTTTATSSVGEVGGAASGGAKTGVAGETNGLAGAKSSGGNRATGGARSTDGTSTGGAASSIGGTPSTNSTRGSGGSSATGGMRATGGTTASAGATSTSGANVCGTAAENASVNLACPQGQIINAIVFASYGNPTGSCGSFTAGSCESTSSKSVVESLCLGRSTCSVPATNGAFGDPCRKTTKHLYVEATCVVGTPIVTADIPYKGVANSPASQIAALGATWCYNWGTAPKSTDCADPYFVPMIWDGSNVAGAIKSIGDAGYTTVLGFNEPNKADQADMLVADAIALWPTVTSNPKIRVGSPAVSDDGRSWLVDFMAQAKTKGLRVDFIAMHWYGWNAGSCVASQLEGAINWASQWGLPVWITEFGCMGSSNTDAQTVLKFFNDAIKMLDNHPLVERYAWYPWNTYNELYQSNTMTELGQAFAAAPKYRQ